MSRQIDLTKPLSDEDRQYLEVRCKKNDLALNAQYMAEQAGDAPPTQATAGQLSTPGNPQTPDGGETGQASGSAAPPATPPGDTSHQAPQGTGDDDLADKPYSEWTKAELRKEIQRRNEEDGAEIEEPPKNANHGDLKAALELDDEEIAKAEAEEQNQQ